ncbi:NAD-dependent epimerase/dehydratase family protein [Candidatus Pacearchaeota archaeon]|nr:NAD-dependent epimerase/dehydratase family protein [Candidatus Pacearchaeota archaeon]
MKKIAVTGAGGFIGHHLVRALKKRGMWVRGLDIKKPLFSDSEADEFWFVDLRNREVALKIFEDIDEIYALGSDVGGVGHLSRWNYEIIKNNLEIDTNTFQGALKSKGKKILYVSSACVYPLHRQDSDKIQPLKEEEAIPANPEGAYGWEKLISEQMLTHASKDAGCEVRIARFQNIYGPEEIFDGGREKVIGALCRKVAMAELNDEVEIWGDGQQRRSFCYVEDAVEGLIELMNSNYSEPLNLSDDGDISIGEVFNFLNILSGKNLKLKNIPGPTGVKGRQSDNEKRKAILKWAPKTDLKSGLAKTYFWVDATIKSKKYAQK